MTRLPIALAIALAAAQPAAAQDTPEPVWMMVQHEVADYAAWREVFDGGLETRRSAGELQFEILKMPGPPDTVLAIFEWEGAEAALAFVNDPFVRAAMQSAGVISDPVVSLHENDPRYWVTSDDKAERSPPELAVAD